MYRQQSGDVCKMLPLCGYIVTNVDQNAFDVNRPVFVYDYFCERVQESRIQQLIAINVSVMRIFLRSPNVTRTVLKF